MNPNGDTAYDAPTSASFAEVDSRLGWTLGYPFALQALGVGGPDSPKTLLDYGCGPGRVANRIARRYDVRIIAVDPSAEMLAIASQRYCHPRITYRQIQDNRLDFLADGSMDAAMSCFVFIVLPSREQLRAIAAEVWRGQIQPVEACASTSSVNSSEGFFQLWILRGRSLISEATMAR